MINKRLKTIVLSLGLLLTLIVSTSTLWADARNPLEPPDTSSPQATLTSFSTMMHEVKSLVEQSRVAGFSRERRHELRDWFTWARRCLDLSQVPEKLRDNVGLDAVVLLAEILDRIDIPPAQAIPDAETMKTKNISRWRIPRTEITIALVEEGTRKGEYLVTSETLDRLKEFYTKVNTLPYRPDAAIGSLGPAGGVYHYYGSLPGEAIPFDWIRRLPSWARHIYFEHTVWQWIAMILSVFIGGLVIMLISVTLSRWPTLHRWLLPLSAASIVYGVVTFINEQIGMQGGTMYDIIEISFEVLFLLLIMWWIMALGHVVTDMIITSPKIDPQSLQASVIKLSGALCSVVIVMIIFFQGLEELGISLLPFLTGLGIGGLAVALAARPTLENLIGGVMVLLDGPYQIGQRINVKGYDGIVERLGIRSTKIRLLNGHQTTIPNEEMARVDIENISRRPYIRRYSNIGITYNTPPEKVEKAIKIIEDILDTHEGMDPELPPAIYFNDFNPDSLNIMMTYWYHPPDWYAANAFDQQVNLAIMRAFEKEGIEFAFPTISNYLTQADNKPLRIRVTGYSDHDEMTTQA